MEIAVRRNQLAWNTHALTVAGRPLSIMDYGEGEILPLAARAEALLKGPAADVSGADLRAVLEHLRGRPLTLQYNEGNRSIRVPFLFDRYDRGWLYAQGAQVLGVPLHRLERATVGERSLGKLRFRVEPPSSARTTSTLSLTLGGQVGTAAPQMSGQKQLLSVFQLLQRRADAYQMPVLGSDEAPPFAEVLQALNGQRIRVHWMSSLLADPVWLGESAWIVIEQVQADANGLRLAGPGWEVSVRNVCGWRVAGSGITVDLNAGDQAPVTAVTLQLVS